MEQLLRKAIEAELYTAQPLRSVIAEPFRAPCAADAACLADNPHARHNAGGAERWSSADRQG
jgi:hypothetical protein